MDIAIVTGAETALGLRIVQTLVQQGYLVHGIGNNFSKVTYADRQFKAHAIDISDLEVVRAELSKILEQENRLDCLVHAIDVTPGAAFEKLPVGNLEAVLKIGLLGPVMMTRLALPNLLRFRGQLINVITGNKHGHPASAVNALIEGGLREMNKALFDQGRDAGLRITNCLIRQNSGLAGATLSDDAIAQTHINLEDVNRTIEQLVDPKAVNVPAEISLHPRLSARGEGALPDAPLPMDPYAVVALPPKQYRPPEEPKIPTEAKQQVERTIPYSDEEMEDKIAAAIEDFDAHPERYDQPDSAPAKKPQQQNSGGSPQGGDGKNKRRRRRGGRNRNKKPQDGGSPNGGSKPESKPAPEAHGQPEPQPQEQEQDQPKHRDKAKQPTPEEKVKQPKPADKVRRPKSGGKNKPDGVGPPEPLEKPAEKADDKPLEKALKKKTAAKKAAKKSVKKAAKKKIVTKKAVKKKAAKKAAGKKKPVQQTFDPEG